MGKVYRTSEQQVRASAGKESSSKVEKSPGSDSRISEYVKVLGTFFQFTEGVFYGGLLLPVMFLSSIGVSELRDTLGISDISLYALTPLSVGLCVLTYNSSGKLRCSMKRRLAESGLAEKLEAGLLENDPIFRATPFIYRWLLERPNWGDVGPDTQHLTRLVNNLDWYTMPARKLFRWQWIVPTIVVPALIVFWSARFVFPSTNSEWVSNLFHWLSANPGRVLTLNVLFLWAAAIFFGIPRHIRAIWHTELLDYLRAYLSARQAAAESSPLAVS